MRTSDQGVDEYCCLLDPAEQGFPAYRGLSTPAEGPPLWQVMMKAKEGSCCRGCSLLKRYRKPPLGFFDGIFNIIKLMWQHDNPLARTTTGNSHLTCRAAPDMAAMPL